MKISLDTAREILSVNSLIGTPISMWKNDKGNIVILYGNARGEFECEFDSETRCRIAEDAI